MGREQPFNFLELVPVRQGEWEETNEGGVILLVPKFHHPWLRRFLLPLLTQKPCLRVRLDDMGSHLWRQCDGHRSVRQLAEDFSDRFHEPLEPLLDRMARFFRQLEREKILIFKRGEASDGSRVGDQAADR